MILELSKRYHLTFATDFTPLNAIYLVKEIYSYNQILEQEIDLFKHLFELVDKTEEELVQQLSAFKQDAFFFLEEANGKGVVCVPAQLVVASNRNVAQYYSTMLAVNLGTFVDPVVVHPITNVILDMLRDRLGNPDQPEEAIENAEELSDLADLHANIQVYNREWMLTNSYEETVKRRRESRIRAEELGGKSHTNYCVMYLNTLETLRQEQSKNAVLEQKLIEIMETV